MSVSRPTPDGERIVPFTRQQTVDILDDVWAAIAGLHAGASVSDTLALVKHARDTVEDVLIAADEAARLARLASASTTWDYGRQVVDMLYPMDVLETPEPTRNETEWAMEHVATAGMHFGATANDMLDCHVCQMPFVDGTVVAEAPAFFPEGDAKAWAAEHIGTNGDHFGLAGPGTSASFDCPLCK